MAEAVFGGKAQAGFIHALKRFADISDSPLPHGRQIEMGNPRFTASRTVATAFARCAPKFTEAAAAQNKAPTVP